MAIVAEKIGLSMTDAYRTILSDEDECAINRFLVMLSDESFRNSLLESEMRMQRPSPETLRENLRLVRSLSDPKRMHTAALAFRALRDRVQGLQIVPDDLLPSPRLVERLMEQYWNMIREAGGRPAQRSTSSSNL